MNTREFKAMNHLKVYARVEGGVVQEVIQPLDDLDGVEYPIDQRYPAQVLEQLVEITGLTPQPDQGWTYENDVFKAPTLWQSSPEETLRINQASQRYHLDQASQAMAPMLISLQLGDATDEETAAAKKWQAYYRALKVVDLSVAEPKWPKKPD
jgi:hypothetical protein